MFVYRAGTGSLIGRVYRMKPNSLKATSSLHKGCVCWVTIKPAVANDGVMARVHDDLREWFAQGLDDVSRENHADLARALKRKNGMAVKSDERLESKEKKASQPTGK